jgi:hypothetical protein
MLWRLILIWQAADLDTATRGPNLGWPVLDIIAVALHTRPTLVDI